MVTSFKNISTVPEDIKIILVITVIKWLTNVTTNRQFLGWDLAHW
jgi:hypothetical protein